MSKILFRALLLVVSFALSPSIGRAWTLESISILADADHLRNPISALAIEDCTQLLKQACGCDVRLNNPNAQVLLQLPEILSDSAVSPFAEGVTYPYLAYPNHAYIWRSARVDDRILMQLQTPTYQGISCGLYGLLQEQLWISFHHPRETNIPPLRYWPLSEDFSWEATPRFDKKGFHLHTMHPIELTEPLLDPKFANGMEQLKQYVDWLARNGQNYLEFNLLEDIDTLKWATHIRELVDYAHRRGILVGVDLSLNMTQQKAYKLYENFPKSFVPRKKPSEKNLAYVCQVPWDVVSLEMSSTEFTSGGRRRKRLQKLVIERVNGLYRAKTMSRKHVVHESNMRQKSKPDTAAAPDADLGLLVHTVMFYGLTDQVAPVYENRNLLHLLDLLQNELPRREVWYYPESAYWITFDNSVPMYLMPYLSTRLRDIELMESLGVKGHLTFSSGWEWGYWSVDWSIARWSWRHTVNDIPQTPEPIQYLGDLFKRPRALQLLQDALDLQEEYIKKRELIRFLAPSSVTDEAPKPFRLEFQPRPAKPYRWWRYQAKQKDLDSLQRGTIEPLLEFAVKNDRIVNELLAEERFLSNEDKSRALFAELVRGLKITGLRAKHRAYTLSALKRKRELELKKAGKTSPEEELEKAKLVRDEAQELVRLQEFGYRYATNLIARPYKGHTVYDFGYLYTVSDLFFWRREEEQIRQDKYGMLFMNIWNLGRTLGVVD